MSVQKALIPAMDVISVQQDQTVLEAVSLIEKRHIRAVPVLDGNKLVGIFSLKSIIRSVLPVGLTIGADEDMQSMAFLHGLTDDFSTKLAEIGTARLVDVMGRDIVTIDLETATTEAMRLLYVKGSPLMVVDKRTSDFKGIVTEQSMIQHLQENLQN